MANRRRVYQVSVALLTLTLLANAENVFVHPALYPAGNTPLIQALADFNGDGKIDALVRNGDPNSKEAFSVVLGKGNGRFGNVVQSPVLSFPTSTPAVGDVNGDGILDLVALDFGSDPGVAHILLGKGDGSFKNAAQYGIGELPSSLLLTDLNGDGHLDIVLLDYQVGTFQSEVMALLNNGDGTFAAGKETLVYPLGTQFAAGDFNHDGKSDLVVGAAQLQILLSNGDGTFQFSTTIPGGGGYVVAADFDGDGILDLATVAFSDLSVFRGNGDTTFQSPKVYSMGMNTGNGSMRVADFNGDGAPDIFWDNFGLNSIVMVNRGGSAGFYNAVSYRTGIFRSTGTVAGDVNGDGRADLVGDAPVQNCIGVLLSHGRNLFDAAMGHGTLKQPPDGMTLGDFNGDGMPDAVVGASDGSVIFLSRPGGRYSPAFNLDMGFDAFSIIAADFNQDQKLDLVATTRDDVELLLGNGDGTFAPETPIDSTRFADQVLAGDFNGDHKLDLAITTGPEVLVLMGNGNGTFQPAVHYPVSTNADWVVAADFNSDGKTDFVVAGVSALAEMLGNGDGTFQPPVTIATGVLIQISALVTGDLNNDGKSDLAMIGFDEPTTMAVFLGNGDSTFQAKQKTHLHADGSASLVLADFNRDGKLDAAIGSNGYKTEFNCLRIVLGNGDGTFQTEQILPYARDLRYWSLAVADYNQDGWPDLIFADTWSQVTFLPNAAGK